MNLFVGCNGGLGKTYTKNFGEKNNLYFAKEKLNLTDILKIEKMIKKYKIKNFINFAAYTNLPLSEKNMIECFNINCFSLINLCEILNKHKVKLFHISTDYVFNNLNENFENQKKNPINIYGLSKNYGEEVIKFKSNNYSIVRTSWLFSKYKNNFVDKIIDKIKKNENLFINNEIGCPTSSDSLSFFINKIINQNIKTKEILHFRNFPAISRDKFTLKIIEIYNKKNKKKYEKKINNILKFDIVERPKISILNCDSTFKKYKIKKNFWKKELNKII